MTPATNVGIDVAKAELVVHVRPADTRWTAANDEAGIRTLVERLQGDAPALIVLEAPAATSWRSPLPSPRLDSRSPW